MNKKVYFLCLLFIIFEQLTFAQSNIVILDSQVDIINLGKYMQFYEDKTKTVSIDQIKDNNFQQNFKKFPTEILNLGANTSALWLKLELNASTNKKYYLQIDNSYLDSVHFYFLDEQNNYQCKLTGKKLPLETEDIASTHCIIEVPIQNSYQVQTFYLRLISNRYLHIEAKLLTQKIVLNNISKRYILELIFFGVILLAIIYNFFVYLSIKDIAFLYYVAYTFFMGLNIFNTRGYLSLFFDEYRIIISHYTYLTSSLYIIFVLLFTIHFLKVKTYSLLLYRILLFFLYISILRTFLTTIGYGSLLFSSGIIFLVINVSVYLIAGIVIYYKKYKPAMYYLASWTLFGVFTLWASLEYTGILTFNSFSKYLNPMGVFLETIVASLALGNRINILKKENKEVHQKNIDLIRQQKDTLEIEVQKRTNELEEKNQEILTQNEELQQQQNELSIINEQLEEKNQEIETQNEELYQQKQELERINNALQIRDKQISMQNAELAQKQVKMITQNEKLHQQKKQIKLLNNNLENLVSQRTQELKDTLDNLTKQNQDLSQFSYIISHNLRSPVARILGLMNLFNEKDYNDDFNKEIIGYLKQTTIDLDTVISDLTQIISVRNDLNKIKEEIDILKIIEQEKFLLKDEIQKSNAVIDISLVNIKSIHSIKSYIQSILYNFISNAIKYKSNKRTPIIIIKTEMVNNFVCLSVQDNGLGLDLLNTDMYKIFGLYQRMHDHVEGKGMGLFLVKTQVESLGGKIEVESKLDVGTTFKVYFIN